jgi:hypothetical protein
MHNGPSFESGRSECLRRKFLQKYPDVESLRTERITLMCGEPEGVHVTF